MITIIQPQNKIEKLWGKQVIDYTETYRLMSYVLQAEVDGKRLLHNVVTGHLVVLDCEEADIIDKPHIAFSDTIRDLIVDHFLVPETCDEHEQVVNLRIVLSKLCDLYEKPGISKYTILPTTACNAKCYYCYEKGIAPASMSEIVAEDVIRFIVEHSCGQDIRIRWFGGEPTLGVKRINQICNGLKKRNIHFTSNIISNGYLFDVEMIKLAKDCWNLTSVKISLDGTCKSYNDTKAFDNAQDNPYEIVMRNIGEFLNQGIRVSVYMNFDDHNYREFYDLFIDMESRFQNSQLLSLRSHQIINSDDDYDTDSGLEKEAWYQKKIFELNEFSRKKKFLKRDNKLPSLEYHWCEATSHHAITILPNGKLVSCPEQLGEDQYLGDLKTGVINHNLACSWRKFGDYSKCHKCVFFPDCLKILRCASGSRCFVKIEKYNQYQQNMINCYNNVLES